jgi:protein-tyrosine phosphatase
MIIRAISSFERSLAIQIQRSFDHGWRHLTGLPTIKRSEIMPQLFLGGQYSLRRLNKMHKMGITAVVNMRTTAIHKKDLALKILNLPTEDKCAPSIAQLKKGVEFMDEEIKKGGKVYVHCKWGEGRGPTMAIAYLIYTGLTYSDAYILVKKVRTFINPTMPQKEVLQRFEQLYQ